MYQAIVPYLVRKVDIVSSSGGWMVWFKQTMSQNKKQSSGVKKGGIIPAAVVFNDDQKNIKYNT